MIFNHSSRTRSWADVRGTAPQFCGPKFMDTGALAVPITGAVRALDGEPLGGRRLARTPPRRVTRRLAASTIALPAPASDRGALFRLPSPSCFLRPQNRGAVIQALAAAS